MAKQMTLISYGSNEQKITPADEGNLSDLGQKKVDVSVELFALKMITLVW